MRLFVFSVYDAAVGSYAQPFFARSQAEAVRMFSQACADENTTLHKHRQDFSLVRLAEFDDLLGTFHESKEAVTTAAAILAVQPQE